MIRSSPSNDMVQVYGSDTAGARLSRSTAHRSAPLSSTLIRDEREAPGSEYDAQASCRPGPARGEAWCASRPFRQLAAVIPPHPGLVQLIHRLTPSLVFLRTSVKP